MSDGQFSSKPIRIGQPREKSWQATDFTSEAKLLTEDARSFLYSRAMQEEMQALADQGRTETVTTASCAPLHKAVPAGARELGRPIASAVLVQEYLIGLIFLRVCGWIFMFFGGLFLVGAFVIAFTAVVNQNVQHRPPAYASIIVAVLGLGIGGAGAWFGIFRGRVIEEMCWFCPRGMIWRMGLNFDWYTWEEVREIYSHLRAVRPAIAIRLEANLSVISFSNTLASIRLVDYIEGRASAACAPLVLQKIADAHSVRFGECRLSRSAFQFAGTEIAWRDIVNLQVQDRTLFVRRLDGSDIELSLEDIPFPRMFVALARGIHAYSRGG